TLKKNDLIRLNSRNYSIFQKISENVRKDLESDKKFQDELLKFKQEAERLENSESLKKAREKFKRIEKQSQSLSGLLKDNLMEISSILSEKSEIIKSYKNLGKHFEQLGEVAGAVKDKIPVDKLLNSANTINKSLKSNSDSLCYNVYKPPDSLKKRNRDKQTTENEIKENLEEKQIELHKDSKWQQSWQKFKISNPSLSKLFKFVESANDSRIIRATSLITQKLSSLITSASSRSEIQAVIDEIYKVDQTFSQVSFINYCEVYFIPNVLEAWLQNRTDILKDWCHEGVFNVLNAPLFEAKKKNWFWDNKLLDISEVDLISAKMMDQGPVLIISFYTQQTSCLRSLTDKKLMQGDPEKVQRVTNIWAVCRDCDFKDPINSWRLIDASSSPSNSWV
ncbi:MAG: Mitochondrial import inner membrane translocase subunit TIM44, partial [Paramarteilia canceri]